MVNAECLRAGTFAVGNMLLVLLVAPLLEGVVRKLRAVVHSRKGPPVVQPYIDLLKLLGKEDLRVSGNAALSLAPLVFLSAILAAAAIMPLGGYAPASCAGDILVFVGLLALAGGALAVLGLAARSPFSGLGASREVMVMLAGEPVLVLCLFVAALRGQTLVFAELTAVPPGLSMAVAAAAYLLALQLFVAKLPFDITEAETELMGGPLTELSGPKLAVCQWGMFAKQFLYGSLFVQVFMPWSIRFVPVAGVRVLLNLAWVFVLNAAIVSVVAVVNPRLRLDQTMRYGAAVAMVAALALAYAVMGT
ncbi:MAG: NADH-quinone oxidoreductase subunit H [Armatimonadota bacterium]|nr:NADH-quinone oxidoreductase subunit H [Armatimonadota bacterium]